MLKTIAIEDTVISATQFGDLQRELKSLNCTDNLRREGGPHHVRVSGTITFDDEILDETDYEMLLSKYGVHLKPSK